MPVRRIYNVYWETSEEEQEPEMLKVQKKIGRHSPKKKTLFSPAMLPRTFELARAGFNNEEIATDLGVAPATFDGWLNRVPFLSELLEAGREVEQFDYSKTFFSRFPDLTRPQLTFLSAYSVCGSVVRAAEVTGITGHYKWMATNDNSYREAFDHADFEARDRLLVEARRRAVDGMERIKFSNGQPIMIPCQSNDPRAIKTGVDTDGDPVYMKMHTERYYSDVLLAKLLDGLHPEFLPKTVNVHHQGGVVAAIVDASVADRSPVVDDKYIEAYARRLDKEESLNSDPVPVEEITDPKLKLLARMEGRTRSKYRE
jgi:hypothetical protein